MTKDYQAGVEIETPAVEQNASRRQSWLASSLGPLVCALFAVIALLLLLMSWRTHQALTTRADDRAEALKAAEQFSLRMDNFKGSAMDSYKSRVTSMLSTKAKAEFNESFPAFETAYEQGNAVSTGKVRVAAVQSIDDVKANVLVIHDRLVETDQGDQQQYLRWQVTTVKVDGKWLVDEFQAVQ